MSRPFLISNNSCLRKVSKIAPTNPRVRCDSRHRLVNLLLLVDTELAGTHVDEQEETTTACC